MRRERTAAKNEISEAKLKIRQKSLDDFKVALKQNGLFDEFKQKFDEEKIKLGWGGMKIIEDYYKILGMNFSDVN